MAENKTQPTSVPVDEFIQQVENPKKRADAIALKNMMEDITGEKAVMWGPSIIGFGTYHYKTAAGEGQNFLITGFSPRKAAISLYIMGCMHPDFGFDLNTLGKFKKSVGCIYINKLTDIHEGALRELIGKGYQYMKDHYPTQ